MLSDLLYRLRAIFRRDRMEAELDEEVREHFERQIQANVDKGLIPAEALRQARLDFGGIDEVKEAARDARGVAFVETTFQDIRFALRSLRRHPGLVATATLSAALGIGVCTLVFGVVNLALYQQLPVQEPERLISITSRNGHGSGQPLLSRAEIRAIGTTDSWESVAYGLPFIPGSIGPSGGVKPAWGALVSGNYFDVVRPAFSLGQGFVDEEDDVKGATPKVVLSHSVWSERYGADETLLGEDIFVNGRPMLLTGVTGPGFKGTTAGLVVDYYLPVSQINELPRNGEPVDLPDDAGLWLVLGRLRAGIDLAQVAAELEIVREGLLAQYPGRNVERGFSVTPASQVLDAIIGGTRPLFLLLLAVSALVLLTACANVANLLLARASMRGPELSTRLALGARSRLVRQLLTESVLLSSAGGVLGLCLASWAGGLGGSFKLPFSIPVDLTLPTDYRTAAAAVALCFASGILFGLVPALRSTKAGVFDGLRSNTGASAKGFRRFGLRNGLAAAQIAMSTALLVCAFLFVRSFGQATKSIVGNLNPEGVTVIGFDPAMSGYDAATARGLLEQILRKAEETPGVLSASITDAIPSLGRAGGFATEPIGENDSTERANVVLITPAVLETLGIRLIDGEGFHQNSPNEGSIIVDDALAQALFPNGGAVGSTLFERSGESYRIVGVAANVSAGSASQNVRPPRFAYRPLLNSYAASRRGVLSGLSLLLKLSPTAPPPSLISQDVLIGLDPNLVVVESKTLEALLRETFMFIQLPAILFGVCGLMGLAISAIGVYGIMSFAVARRSKEIGIRLALGAEAWRIVRGVVSHGTAVTLTGLGVGLVGGCGLARLAGSFIVGVTPLDPVTYASVTVIIVAVALAASAVPASRAASVNPAETLRSE